MPEELNVGKCVLVPKVPFLNTHAPGLMMVVTGRRFTGAISISSNNSTIKYIEINNC